MSFFRWFESSGTRELINNIFLPGEKAIREKVEHLLWEAWCDGASELEGK